MAQDAYLDVEGAKLRYRAEGDRADAPWIVLGNSLLTDLSVWGAQAECLAQRYRVLRYDQRGHGRSTASGEALTFDILGSDLLALLDALDIAACSYVGLSMGVPTGLSALRSDAGRFECLVFVDGMAKTAAAGAEVWEERIAFARAEGMAQMAEATVQRWLRPQNAAGERGQTLRAMIAGTPLDGFVQCARALQAYDYLDQVAQIGCPLLAIAGAADGAMPDTMQATFGAVAAQPVVAIANAGHIPNFEQPAAFNEVLLAFLAQAG